ncbi:hypothetical protein C8Q79DRAFT_918896 [Trametes meyenii]|nr:hypothetical protein C8Q79DRAFT_918896 [Trametes meyenii]
MFNSQDPSRINYGTSASHATVQAELSGKTAFSDNSVLVQLRIDDVDSHFVHNCARTLKESLKEDIRALSKIVKRAERKDPKYLEHEVLDDLDYPNPREVLPKDRRSYRQEQSLVLKHIQCAPEPDEAKAGDYNRCFSHRVLAADCGTPEKDYTLGFPNFYPDFILTRMTQLGNPLADARTRGWHDRDGFVVIRPSSRQHPYPAPEDGLARPILTHAANCARLHLSARPFLLFSVCLLVFGGDFCVCIFDRAGARVSPKLNMWRDLDTFIRVVRSMTRRLTDVELGRDPSVSPAPPDLQTSLNYPAWIIDPVGSDPRRWCTVGAPIWSSLSLFGRGTFVWYVRELSATGELSGPVMILKSAWRSSQRDPESSIYQAVRGDHPGLAKYVVGADVVPFPGSLEKITTNYLHKRPLKSDEKTEILHRIVIGTTGKPIWMYDTEEQLIDGLISALEAHKFLWDQKILHRDISAGNVLLSDYPEDVGAAGFLTDLDLASIEADAEIKSTETVHATSEYGRYPQRLQGPMTRTRIRFGTQRGDPIVGTLQFMSRRLLHSLHFKDASLVPTAADDVESFFWVLVYAVFRKLLAAPTANDEEKTEVLTHFRDTFGRTSVLEILTARGEFFHDGIYKQATYCRMVSYPMRRLLLTYRVVLSGLVPTIPLSRRAGVTSSYGGSASTGGRIIDEASVAGSARYNRCFSHEGMIKLLQETHQALQKRQERGERGVQA